MKLFVHMKHWKLFLLVIGQPFLVSLLLNLIAISGIAHSPDFFSSLMFISLVFSLLIFYLWVWSAITLLKNEVKGYIESWPKAITFSLLISLTFSLLSLFYFYLVSSSGISQPEMLEQAEFTVVLGIIMFISLSLLFINLTHLAKTLVTSERKYKLKKAEYFSEFVMLLLFPIGIWLLQPRINKQFGK